MLHWRTPGLAHAPPPSAGAHLSQISYAGEHGTDWLPRVGLRAGPNLGEKHPECVHVARP
jgi:hypothetical protein